MTEFNCQAFQPALSQLLTWEGRGRVLSQGLVSLSINLTILTSKIPDHFLVTDDILG